MIYKLIVAMLIGIFIGTVIPTKEPEAQFSYILASGDIQRVKKELTAKIKALCEGVSKLEERCK